MSKSINRLTDDNSESGELSQSNEKSVANLAINPNLLAAHTIRNFSQVVGTVDLIELVGELPGKSNV